MFDNRLNILLIEDNPGDAILIKEFLLDVYSDNFILDYAPLLSEGLEKLDSNEYDIILLDLGLPDSSGLNAIDLINSKAPSTPITILSGLEDEQTALKALQLGAQDYFIKGRIDSRSFTRSVRYAIERKKTEEKLRENEGYYYSLFEKNRSIMMLLDSENGDIIDVNASACEYYGYSRDEFLKLHISEINMLSRAGIAEKMTQAFSYKANGFQFRHRLKSGEIRDVEVFSGPIRRGSRKILYSIVHDVTERRRMEEKISRINEQLEIMVEERTADLKLANESLQVEIHRRSLAENALKQSELKYKTVIDFTQDWETWIGPAGEYIYISPSCEAISGYSEKDFFSDPDLIFKICHTDDLPLFRDHIGHILKRELKDCSINFRIFTKSGEMKWIGHRCQPVYDQNGVWLGQRGSNRDITENKRAEDEIQLLYTITQSISETGNFDEAMNNALQKICEAAGWCIGEVWIPNKANTILSLRAGYGSDNEKYRKFIEESRIFKFSPSIGMPGRTWSSKEPLWIYDVTKDLSFLRAPNAQKAGLKTAISLPVFSGDIIVAVFNFFLPEAREKNEQDLRLFTAIASQLGSVIHRRLAEERIHHSEEQYRKLFENMSGALIYGEMIYHKNKPNDFIFLNVNSAFERLTGFRDVIGRKASEIIPNIDTSFAQVLAGFGTVASSGKPVQMEIYLELIREWALVSVYSPQRDYFISIFDIITPRKEREEQIRIERQRLNSIISISHAPAFSTKELFDYALQEAISLSSSEIGFLYHYNDELEEFTLHSWSKETMKECHILNPSVTHQLNKTGLWGEAVRQKTHVIVNDYSAPNEFKKGLPSGHAPIRRFMTVPIFNKGKIVAVAGVANKKADYTEFDAQQFTLIMTAIWEIGEHKKVESELEKYRMHLELLIDERTNELKETNELLQEEIRKQKEAEEKVKDALTREKELNELKSRFVSMISHEYRTPLTAILSSTELLELYGHKWSEEKKKEHLDKIKGSVNYMTEMLKDVLLINRAEAGRLDFNPDNLELVGFCRTLVREIQLIAGTKCSIAFASNVESLNTFMDKKLLQYIFNNLLVNAVNYSSEDGKIRFELLAGDKDLIFNVTDNGIGIPEEDLQRLFEQFYRGKNTTNIPGTGLGLSIVKRCVDLHNGRIEVESKVGSGTAFTVVIPIIEHQFSKFNLN